MSDLLAAILAEARAQVAAGRAPNLEGLKARISAAANGVEAERALRSLDSIAAVHRARARLAREFEPAPPAPRRAALRTKPTISGTLDVRRAPGEGFRVVWDPIAAVSEWEVRFSERPDARSDYAERESVVLGAHETSVEVPLGDNPLRVNILGRGRGKLQRRALISGLTRDGWRDRWQRRASAS